MFVFFIHCLFASKSAPAFKSNLVHSIDEREQAKWSGVEPSWKFQQKKQTKTEQKNCFLLLFFLFWSGVCFFFFLFFLFSSFFFSFFFSSYFFFFFFFYFFSFFFLLFFSSFFSFFFLFVLLLPYLDNSHWHSFPKVPLWLVHCAKPNVMLFQSYKNKKITTTKFQHKEKKTQERAKKTHKNKQTKQRQKKCKSKKNRNKFNHHKQKQRNKQQKLKNEQRQKNNNSTQQNKSNNNKIPHIFVCLLQVCCRIRNETKCFWCVFLCLDSVNHCFKQIEIDIFACAFINFVLETYKEGVT